MINRTRVRGDVAGWTARIQMKYWRVARMVYVSGSDMMVCTTLHAMKLVLIGWNWTRDTVGSTPTTSTDVSGV